MDIAIKQYVTRHFAVDKPNYFHQAPVKFRLYTKVIKPNVLSIDYDKKHELLINDEVAGYLRFDKPVLNNKLIDLRGMKLIRNDY